MVSAPGSQRQPLWNYRVIDLGSAWAGPMATQLLADLGAQVIKVESRQRMDGLRLGRPMVGEDIAGGDQGLWPELQPLFHGLNRNKCSVTLNLKTGEGVGLLKELAGRSDVVLSNYSPGVLERMGIDYQSLRRARPDIIQVSMPSVGESGPMRDILAYAPIIQALSGFMSLVGYDDESPLVGELQAPWSDTVASVHAALAIVAALRHRNLTGEGQKIEVAQLEASVSMLGEPLLEYQMTGTVARPVGNFDRRSAPNGNYPCAGDDEWMAVSVDTDEEWNGLCRAMGNPAWSQGVEFEDKLGRVRNFRALDRRLASWTRQYSAEDAARLLQRHGVAAMPVMNIEDQFRDPHLRDRGAYSEVEHPHVGTEWVYGTSWLLSDTPANVRTSAPLLGEHNGYVFEQLLGLSPEDMNRLVALEVIY